MSVTATITYTPRDTADSAVCRPAPDDVRGDPHRCVIAHYLAGRYPWMKSITAGLKTIRVYDYRCAHNPEGKQGRCSKCPGRCLVWATPLPVADAIRRFDRGEDPEFPPFALREDEARVMLSRQDPVKKRQAMKRYRGLVIAGEHKPNKRSAKAKGRDMSNRRKG